MFTSAELGTTLVEAGLAVATLRSRDEDARSARGAGALVDSATAAVGWLVRQPEVDRAHLGILGCGTGAIVAGCVAGRLQLVERLCLLAPITIARATVGSRAQGDSAALDMSKVSEAFLRSLDSLEPERDAARHARRTLVVHPAADRLAPPESLRPWLDALELAERSVEVELLALADRELASPDVRQACLERIGRFFAEIETHAPSGAAA
jgi:hypothetical protein